MIPAGGSLERGSCRAWKAFRAQANILAKQLVTFTLDTIYTTSQCSLAGNFAGPSSARPLCLRCPVSWGVSHRRATHRCRASEPSPPIIASDELYSQGTERPAFDDKGGRSGARSGLGLSAAASAAAAAATTPAPAKKHKNGPKQRIRLDEYCLQLAPQYSRNVIQSFILQGKVRVDDKVVTKAGAPVLLGPGGPQVVIDAEEPKYVCRAGLKLEKALELWGIDVRGLTALDSGQSTGGFTDCLLRNGAAKVYGIDVGFNQLADRIRRDERVVVMEKFNLRHLRPQHLPCKVDIATLDLSFISVLLVVGAVTSVLRPDGGRLVVLIKPQFEAGRRQVRAGGIVRDPQVHAEVLERVTGGIQAHGYELVGTTESPIKGDKSGNTEFLAYFIRRPELGKAAMAKVVEGEEEEEEEEKEGADGAGLEVAEEPSPALRQ
ncbi:hypothetical protein VOLCADRAFT_82618 [Volvox carteri f. nagariensis]|uniref:RNA-binding S4 domain-containing protein n=1 Tax=Volvox carteri f. nagariensis TaxID=3068 RepID=D8U604_VOLCA|nr:uncharacterized protein VOLCADRAFT_82618 [Volvox carteri f. nagariensis]EFJ44852.1 hypothetical protein VOLCADRAFT_82618 [Volvox carteri f. nagariensis]|eukprot:XP_002954135.1 hypothetical protein VOLCADRAFT_82618 [Volvox carteri f. nagariensis]